MRLHGASRTTHRAGPGPRRSVLAGGAVVLALFALVLAGGCSKSRRSGASAVRGPSRLVHGGGTIPGDKGYSLIQNAITPRKSGDFAFDDGDLVIRIPRGGVVDLGPVEYDAVLDAPADGYESQAQVVVGHVYCIELDAADVYLYAKLKVTSCQRQRYLGLRDGKMQFDYTLQANASRSFRPYVPEATTQQVLAERGVRLEQKRSGLQAALDKGIPQFHRKLRDQAREVNAQLQAGGLSANVRDALERELREIARLLLALDAHARRCRQALALVASAQRQLERLAESEGVIGQADQKVQDEIQRIEQEAGLLVETPLSPAGMGGGAIEDAIIDRKVQELRSAS